MIKPLWSIRNVHKLFNGLNISVSVFMLGYSLLNIFLLETAIPQRVHFFTSQTTFSSRFVLLILPIVGVIISCTLFFVSNIPKRLKYEINESTRQTALKDIKNHRELIIGSNFLVTLCIFFMQLDALNIAKGFQGFGLIPSACFLTLLIAFIIMKLIKTRRLHEI